MPDYISCGASHLAPNAIQLRRDQMKFIERFWKEEQGQDLIEYSLLLGFVALFSTGLYTGLSGNINSIWTSTNNTLGSATKAS
jgi:Flp pilus assembly pilin Flp